MNLVIAGLLLLLLMHNFRVIALMEQQGGRNGIISGEAAKRNSG